MRRLKVKELVAKAHASVADLPPAQGQTMRDVATRLDATFAALTESRREFRAADATIHNLELKVSAMVAENAGLKQAITTHSESTHFCEVCGKDDPCSTDDVCYVLNETPETDAYLAEVRAQARNEGINYAASRLAAAYNHGFVDKPLAEVYDVVRMILTTKEDLANDPAADGLSGEYAEKSLVEFAAQLRQGAEHE